MPSPPQHWGLEEERGTERVLSGGFDVHSKSRVRQGSATWLSDRLSHLRQPAFTATAVAAAVAAAAVVVAVAAAATRVTTTATTVVDDITAAPTVVLLLLS